MSFWRFVNKYNKGRVLPGSLTQTLLSVILLKSLAVARGLRLINQTKLNRTGCFQQPSSCAHKSTEFGLSINTLYMTKIVACNLLRYKHKLGTLGMC